MRLKLVLGAITLLAESSKAIWNRYFQVILLDRSRVFGRRRSRREILQFTGERYVSSGLSNTLVLQKRPTLSLRSNRVVLRISILNYSASSDVHTSEHECMYHVEGVLILCKCSYLLS